MFFFPCQTRRFPHRVHLVRTLICVTIQSSGMIHDIEFAATNILDDPPDQASFIAHLITSGAGSLSQDPAHPITSGNVVRLNPWIQPVSTPAGWWAAPSIIGHAVPTSSVPTNYASDDEAFQGPNKTGYGRRGAGRSGFDHCVGPCMD